jgi:hypothetical protein
MYGSQKYNGKDIMRSVYNDKRTVFKLIDIAQLTGEVNFLSLNNKLNYYVRTGKLLNPRKGIYTKELYDPLELSCIIYTPSYISLEYVLQKSGVIFQYDPRITLVSYLSRSILINEMNLNFCKIKNDILLNTEGIMRQTNHVNIATPERALLDLMYLNSQYYVDNPGKLDRKMILRLLNIYQSETLINRVNKMFKNDRY